MPAVGNTTSLRNATKLQAASLELAALARRLGPGAKLPTFVQLRHDLGISVTTLNGVLDDLEAQGILYRRHGVGIFVSEKLLHRTIVLICDPAFFGGEGASPFWEMLIEHARQRASEKAEDFSLHFSLPAAGDGPLLGDALASDIRNGRVDGVLGVGLLSPTVKWLDAQGVPFVAFAGMGPVVVQVDGPAMVRLGVGALAAQGCRRIGLWSPVVPPRPLQKPHRLATAERDAFEEALRSQGLPFEPALLRDNAALLAAPAARMESLQEQGRRTALETFGPEADADMRPDGVVCLNDMMMQGALPLLQRLGVGLGDSVRIATHGNAGSSVLFGYEDLLTRLEVDPAALVQEMFRLLELRMEGKTPPEQFVRVAPRLRPAVPISVGA